MAIDYAIENNMKFMDALNVLYENGDIDEIAYVTIKAAKSPKWN